MDLVVGLLLAVMGVAIAGIWTRDIVVRDDIDLRGGLLRARNSETGMLFWPHWLAEYATAIGLVIAGVGVMIDATWAPVLGGVGSGALLYTSINSLGWAFAERERYSYAIPMVLGAAIGLGATAYLLAA